jgi:hypothetical protein
MLLTTVTASTGWLVAQVTAADCRDLGLRIGERNRLLKWASVRVLGHCSVTSVAPSCPFLVSISDYTMVGERSEN